MAALSAPSFKLTYLVTPVPVFLALPESVSSCMIPQTRIFPHLDLDYIPESIQVGVRDGLSLGIYVIRQSCVITGVLTP